MKSAHIWEGTHVGVVISDAGRTMHSRTSATPAWQT